MPALPISAATMTFLDPPAMGADYNGWPGNARE
jgi:hypothetical protein